MIEILNGKMAATEPLDVKINKLRHNEPPIINGQMNLDVNINGWTRMPTLSGCVLDLPLYHTALSPNVFKSLDKYSSVCTANGAVWTPQGRYFDSTIPSYLEIPAAYTQLDFTSEDFSIVARVKATQLDDREGIFVRGVYQTDGYTFTLVGPNGYLLFETYQQGVRQFTYSYSYNCWGVDLTIGLSRSGASVILYEQGIDVTDTYGTHLNPKTCSRSALVGIQDNKVDWPLEGNLEFLRVFGGIALSASEHLAYHNALKWRTG